MNTRTAGAGLWLAALVVVGGMLVLSGSWAQAASYEAVGNPIEGALDVLTDVRFPVTIDRPGTLRITATAEDTLKFNLYLYDVNGTTSLAQETAGHASVRTVERAGLAPGTYFVRLYRTHGHGGYRLLAQVSADPTADGPGVGVPSVDAPPGDPDATGATVKPPDSTTPDTDDDTSGRPGSPPVDTPTDWMDVRAGDLCLRVPQGWYDNTESGKQRTEPGVTLIGYWASTPIVQGPGTHFAVSLATKAKLEEDIAENERDPGMVLVDRRQADLAMPDLFPVQLTISEYGAVGGMLRGTFESYELVGQFEVERTQ